MPLKKFRIFTQTGREVGRQIVRERQTLHSSKREKDLYIYICREREREKDHKE